MLQEELQQLDAKTDQDDDDDVPEFGERVFKCKVAKGVGYRNTPTFGDKNKDVKGPVGDEVVIASGLAQGPQAVFLQDARNGLWLPLSNPEGKTIFSVVGMASETDMKEFKLCSGVELN
eukprot:TRINITY_DN13986_c0_g1_i5.p2 TRINITY_DN13986_c0_g1~~TRINITY_DN13986_c0_g1_i5.p2  ORF type:complete len:119 (+),score=35.17 TRINITY_DN13986_c0_g1_i5:325-681(+)